MSAETQTLHKIDQETIFIAKKAFLTVEAER